MNTSLKDRLLKSSLNKHAMYLGWGAAVSFGSEETVKLAAKDSASPSILTEAHGEERTVGTWCMEP